MSIAIRLSRRIAACARGALDCCLILAAYGLGTLLVSMPRAAYPAPPVGTPTVSGVLLCKTLLDRYRPLANTHPGKPPLEVLENTGTAGFKLAGRGEVILNLPSDLVSWARRQRPSVSISAELSEWLASDLSGGVLQKAPGLPLFMLSRNQGSAGCDNSVFFFVRGGVALPSLSPFREDECTPTGTFASLDSKPLYVRQSYGSGPGDTASLNVATWRADHFEEACSVSLLYSPQVSAEILNSHEGSCNVSNCDAMRRAAFELANAKVTGKLSVEALVSRLTAQEREQYQSQATAAAKNFDADESRNAILVPYVQQGEVYVARIAGWTIGWRDLADQNVKFEQLADGKIVEKAAFSVRVWKGELKRASVQSSR